MNIYNWYSGLKSDLDKIDMQLEELTEVSSLSYANTKVQSKKQTSVVEDIAIKREELLFKVLQITEYIFQVKNILIGYMLIDKKAYNNVLRKLEGKRLRLTPKQKQAEIQCLTWLEDKLKKSNII